MIVSRVANKSIRNMNETKYSNKNINKISKMMKQHPNMLDMFKIYCKKIKQHKQSEFQKLTQNQPVYNELSLNLEPKVIDVQLS
jgi:ssDNA-binding replication factor A large subunit